MPAVEFFSRADFKVTNTQLVFANAFYPVRTVTAVRIARHQPVPESRWGDYGEIWAYLVAFGFFQCLLGYLLDWELWIIANVVLAGVGVWRLVAALVHHTAPPMYFLVYVSLLSRGQIAVSAASESEATEIKNAIAAALDSSLTPGSHSVADELSKLAVLRDSGVLSGGDFERGKDLFLGKRPDEQAAAVVQLQQLYDLHRRGVLSQFEFNNRKWEILSRSA